MKETRVAIWNDSELWESTVWATGVNNSNSSNRTNNPNSGHVTILFPFEIFSASVSRYQQGNSFTDDFKLTRVPTQSKTKNSLLGTEENQRQHLKILPGTASNKRLGSRT